MTKTATNNLLFTDVDFDTQLLRSLGHVYDKGADFSECIATAYQIEDGNYDSWHAAWLASAQKLETIGRKSILDGHIVSGRRALFRATEYYRQAEYFLRETPTASDNRELSLKLQDCFRLATSHIHPKAIILKVPFEDNHLAGYFMPADSSVANGTTLIFMAGYDSFAAEGFFLGGRAALSRGYNIVLFDGPGQGHTLRQFEIPMQPNWGEVIGSLLDHCDSLPGVDLDKTALIGRNFAGYLAANAAATEPRINALVADPGQHDMYHVIKRQLSHELISLVDNEKWDEFDTKMQIAFKTDQHLRFFFMTRAAAHGLEKPSEYMQALREYQLGDLITKITCPTAICASVDDATAYEQSQQLLEKLTCEKVFFDFSTVTKERNDSESDIAAPAMFYLRVFDWLDDIFR